MVDRQNDNNREDTNNERVIDQKFLKAEIVNSVISRTSANIIICQLENNNDPIEEALRSHKET